MKRQFLLMLICFACWLEIGCADLKGISTFSASSAKTLSQQPSYGYTRYCGDSCYIYAKDSPYIPCPCESSEAVLYDTLLGREAVWLVAYFNSLSQLSGAGTVIDVDTLAGTIQAGQYGQYNVSSTDVQVFSGVTTAVRDLLTAGVKSKDIRRNLHRYGDSVTAMMDLYILQLSALDGLTGNLVIHLKQQLTLYGFQASPGPQRYAVLHAFIEKIHDLHDRDHQMGHMIQQLQLVRNGYHQLVENADNLSSKTLKQKLLALVNNIGFLSGNANP
jgi:hypothetical protein